MLAKKENMANFKKLNPVVKALRGLLKFLKLWIIKRSLETDWMKSTYNL
jgi:hypothetical protein